MRLLQHIFEIACEVFWGLFWCAVAALAIMSIYSMCRGGLYE